MLLMCARSWYNSTAVQVRTSGPLMAWKMGFQPNRGAQQVKGFQKVGIGTGQPPVFWLSIFVALRG